MNRPAHGRAAGCMCYSFAAMCITALLQFIGLACACLQPQTSGLDRIKILPANNAFRAELHIAFPATPCGMCLTQDQLRHCCPACLQDPPGGQSGHLAIKCTPAFQRHALWQPGGCPAAVRRCLRLDVRSATSETEPHTQRWSAEHSTARTSAGAPPLKVASVSLPG